MKLRLDGVEKVENAGNQHFLLFPQGKEENVGFQHFLLFSMFSKGFCLKSLKLGIVW